MSNKARFVFYLEGFGNTGDDVAYYSIIEHENRKLIGSTVTNECLRNGFKTPVPPTPEFKRWKRDVTAKRRCGACWFSIRTKADRDRHMELLHKEPERLGIWR